MVGKRAQQLEGSLLARLGGSSSVWLLAAGGLHLQGGLKLAKRERMEAGSGLSRDCPGLPWRGRAFFRRFKT